MAWAWMVVVGLAAGVLQGRAAEEKSANPDAKEIKTVADKAIAFLKKQQREDGSFSQRMEPGVCSLVATALLRLGVDSKDPLVANTMRCIESKVQKDGGVYGGDTRGIANYTTCIGIMALQEANTDKAYDAIIKKATEFVRTMQVADVDVKDPRHGAATYDGKKGADLSNTSMFVEALLAAGVPKDDPAVKNALRFISRCQNLPGEHNDLAYAAKAAAEDKGGFVYNPLDTKHLTPAGGLQSAGGMTYAGLKSFLYAGVDRDDPRVKAAVAWIRAHYTLDENPGVGQAGLYYYYHTFAKAMDALGEDPFKDKDGKPRAWKRDLFEALKARQGTDGSWRNDKDRQFGESDPSLATAFALLSLSYCQPPAK
jgi:squalene-hopene/tetraprenyl-beta-curcumene cyclase